MTEVMKPYTDNFDTLIAIVTYLSSTDATNVEVQYIAKGLGLDPDKVKAVLQRFPGFFRKADDKGKDTYSLILRYSRSDVVSDIRTSQPLEPAEFATLLDLISKMVAHENELARLYLDLSQRNRTLLWTSRITMIAALIAALAAIATAFIKR